MSIVTLVSGGVDSTVMAVLARESGVHQLPLFIDYGQLGAKRELAACRKNLSRHKLPQPRVVRLQGYGSLLKSGLTSRSLDVFVNAFLPCRNLMFLMVGAAYGFQNGANTIAIGLLDESVSIFPDQTTRFLRKAEAIFAECLAIRITVIAPLIELSKAQVVAIAGAKKIVGTYSCHSGKARACGRCVACLEFEGTRV